MPTQERPTVLERLPLYSTAMAASVATLALAGCGSSKDVSSHDPYPSDANRDVILDGSAVKEERQFEDSDPNIADTFADYMRADIPGPKMPKGTVVTVDCYVKGPKAAAKTAEGAWYHLIAPAQYTDHYAPANTFVNGQRKNGPAIDPKVPKCPTPPEFKLDESPAKQKAESKLSNKIIAARHQKDRDINYALNGDIEVVVKDKPAPRNVVRIRCINPDVIEYDTRPDIQQFTPYQRDEQGHDECDPKTGGLSIANFDVQDAYKFEPGQKIGK